ncbi:PIG-L deacetylase family protein [Dictyobacter kobayashii]|uniref:GlcNAc-PI de-N-acetylase n=1 Tax=Dictyobacter kobayashii TaxID=2014872 RepID=A0A402ABK9_9CHLR|nr:PIG-L deacetylase family protein [Dictyobacter kobayashii]GCE16477.1 GlcNAc-PI de-N-acetylase [Dictyobacter kobayashii]
MQDEQNKVAMVVVAHPDDAEFDSAGAAALWAREGWDVYYVICTDASGGGPDAATDVSAEARRRVSQTRMEEQRAAANILGIKDVIFLGYPDGCLQPGLDLRRSIVRQLRTYCPSRVICQSPERSWTPELIIPRYHPDHLAAGEAALAAVYPASQNPWDFPELLDEGLRPHKVSEVYITGAPVQNHSIDISSTIDIKLAALRAHASQVGEGFAELEKFLRELNAQTGQKYGYAYAEEFHRVENR